MAQVNWERSLQLEQAFATHIAEQEDYGFLVDQDLIKNHIADLSNRMEGIRQRYQKRMPYLCKPFKKVKGGGAHYFKKPFLTNGVYSEPINKWYRLNDIDPTKVEVVGQFTRIELRRISLDSNAELKDYLLSVGWKPEAWNYNKKTRKRTSAKLSVKDKFLGVKGEVGVNVAHRLQCRHRRSQLEGWQKNVREDGRIGAGAIGMTITGRLKHRTVVNIPGGEWGDEGEWKGAFFGHEMRSCFVAKPGYKIVGCDADQIQLRMLCHYMGDPSYTAAVESGSQDDGTDIHSVNTRLAGLAERAEGKKFIYAFLFGAGDGELAVQLKTTIGRVRRTRARFIRKLPKLAALVAALKREWKKKGYLIGLDGRKIWIEKEHTLLVYLMQCAEAVLMKAATVFAHIWIAKKKYDAHMVAHVHDEYQWEVREDQAEAVGELLSRAIVKAYEYFEINVQGGAAYDIGDSWAETH